MTNKDAWDEALLGSSVAPKELKPQPALLPTAPILKTLVPLAGLLLALTAVSGFELAGKISVPRLAFSAPSLLDFSNFSFNLPAANLKNTLATAGDAGAETAKMAAAGANISKDLLITGYDHLGEVSLLVALNAINNLVQEFSAINELRKLTSLPPAGGQVAASAVASLSEWYQASVDQVSWWLATARDFLFAYGQAVGERWRAFLAGRAASAPAGSNVAPLQVTLDPESKNDLREIKAGVTQILQKLNQTPTGRLPNQGMVVIPKIDRTNSATLQARVGSVFSDQVQVSLDASGKAGVVTPVFRNGPGDNYLFLLTPVTP